MKRTTNKISTPAQNNTHTHTQWTSYCRYHFRSLWREICL